MEFLLVVLGELLLVLHLVLVHLPEFVHFGPLCVEIADQPIDALFGVRSAVFALALMDNILAL
jgi:hypothetical protein